MGTVGIQQILAVLDTVEFGIVAIDHKDRIILCNRIASGFLGLKNVEVLGKPIQSIIPDSLLPQVRQDGLRHVNQKFFLGDRCFLVNRAPVKYRGGLVGAVVWLQNVTDVEKMSRELGSVSALNRERQDLKEEVVAQSRQMQEILALARRIAAVDSTVLLLGESGVGKDLVARHIHWSGRRSLKGDMVKLNCAAVHRELLEVELFGYEAGAFSGARRDSKPGYFELAQGGTLYLDEISAIPPELQVKLLRVLQDREVTRLGTTKPKPVDVRFIAATNCNLQDQVYQGRFREDLFYRINVIPIEIPPLRQRREDIPGLVQHFTKRCNDRFGLNKYFLPEAVELMTSYPWPGNVRELANMVERMLVTISREAILPEDLQKSFAAGVQLDTEELQVENNVQTSSEAVQVPLSLANLSSVIADTEKQLIEMALQQHRTTRKAAEALGMSQSTFSRRVRKHLLTGVSPRARIDR